jgi:hypothetical protein
MTARPFKTKTQIKIIMKPSEISHAMKVFAGLATVMLILLLLNLICPTPKADAQTPLVDTQGYASTVLAPTGCPTNLAAGTTSNSLTAPIILRKGQGLGLSWTYNGSTNTSLTLTASADGTNYFPFSTLAQTNALATVNGTNLTTLGTNYSPATLAGLYSLNISAMTTTGTIALTNAHPSAPVIVNRPN